MSTLRSLHDWLTYIERQHPQSISLGLERVRLVLARLALPHRACVFTVGGTNGKGSTTAMLEAMLHAAGYRTGRYSSPHLLRYNERVRVDACDVSDATLVEGFEAVERAREGIALTYFEYGTLAAIWTFAQLPLDAWVMEVGLGGRLDAVNVLDADCAVLTGVALDHMDYLGDSREAIGYEKAGIFRAQQPAVIADLQPPASVLEVAARVGAQVQLVQRDFGYAADKTQWLYWGPFGKRPGLAYPALRGPIQLLNAAAAITALDSQRTRLPISMQDVRRGLAEVTLPGRFQVLPGQPAVILDVAHNPQAAKILADNLFDSGFAPDTHAVFGALRDKDIAGVVQHLVPRITHWHLADTEGPRGTTASALADVLKQAGVAVTISQYANPAAAFRGARSVAGENDKIVVFGSFVTVSGVMQELTHTSPHAELH